MSVTWVKDTSGTRLVGLIGGGMRISVELEPEGWAVSFAHATLQEKFAHEGAAKEAGIVLAKRILTQVLINLGD